MQEKNKGILPTIIFNALMINPQKFKRRSAIISLAMNEIPINMYKV
jgi:hypothetical protein